MMGQQQQQTIVAEQEAGGALMRRMILVLAVAALMVAITMATALTAFAAPNPGSAAGQCKPPGQTISNLDHPTNGPIGQVVKGKCAPGQR